MPGNLDVHQFLQVRDFGQRGCFVYGGGVVDRGDGELFAPVALLVAVVEDLVADALDVGRGLKVDGAFAKDDGRGGRRGGGFGVVV